MSKRLWLVLIVAGLLALPAASRAFDPAAWLAGGLTKMDARAVEIVARSDHGRKKFASGGQHGATMSRLKKYFKGDGRKGRRR